MGNISVYIHLLLNLPSDNLQGIIHSERKVDTIRRIPPISSNQFSFPACSQLNTNYHLLPNYYTFYGFIIGLHIAIYIRRASYSASTCHPHTMGSNPPSSSLLPLAAWRSRRVSLYRCTRREIATWVVTDIIWKRCFLHTPFLDKDPPSIPPTMLAVNWSISPLSSFPMRPKLSTARVTSLWLRSSKDTCPTRS